MQQDKIYEWLLNRNWEDLSTIPAWLLEHPDQAEYVKEMLSH